MYRLVRLPRNLGAFRRPFPGRVHDLLALPVMPFADLAIQMVRFASPHGHRSLIFALLVLVFACDEPGGEGRAEGDAASPNDTAGAEVATCAEPAIREVVDAFGRRLRGVPLLAADTLLIAAIRDAYAPFVTPELLASWVAEPTSAPGRDVSSPWPERIEIAGVEADGTACRVRGELIYVTSVEAAPGGSAVRQPVELRVIRDGVWRIDAYETAGGTSDGGGSPDPVGPEGDAAAAADVLRRYYQAIGAKDFRAAYEFWGNAGAASNQTFDEFARGFAETAEVTVDLGAPSRIEAAAGSRYVEVPVVVRATTTSGAPQRFEGRYTLRRVVVDGATEAQRRWHIDSAALVPVR